MDFFSTLAQSSDPLVAILAALVVVLSGVIVYQWNYTANNTVPKWIWDEFVTKVDVMIGSITVIKTIVERKP